MGRLPPPPQDHEAIRAAPGRATATNRISSRSTGAERSHDVGKGGSGARPIQSEQRHSSCAVLSPEHVGAGLPMGSQGRRVRAGPSNS